MRNKRLFIVLGCAAVFGLLAVLSVTSYLAKAKGYSDTSRIVVAKVDIPLGTKIIAEQLSTVNFARGTTPEGTFNDPEKLVGRVAITNIAALEPFTNLKLAAEGSAGGLSAVIPEGYRAMTVKVDDVVGLSGFLMPGALVDVVVVIDPAEKNSGSQNMVSKIVLQNIKVLASGFNIDRPKNDREAESVKTVTLQVTPDQAEKLALASTEGKVRLMMRNGVDQSDQQTAGATKRSLLTGEQALPAPDPGINQSVQPRPVVVRRAAPRPAMPVRREARVTPAAAPAPARMYNVEIFEGAKKRTVDFP